MYLVCNYNFVTVCHCQWYHIQNSLARAVVKAPRSTHITPILKSLHWLKVTNALNINFSLLLTKFLQLLNLANFTTLSLFNLLAVPVPHLFLLFTDDGILVG